MKDGWIQMCEGEVTIHFLFRNGNMFAVQRNFDIFCYQQLSRKNTLKTFGEN